MEELTIKLDLRTASYRAMRKMSSEMIDTAMLLSRYTGIQERGDEDSDKRGI